MKNRSPHLVSMWDKVTQFAVSLFVFIALLPACLSLALHAQSSGSADPQLAAQQEKLQSAVKKGDAAEVRSLLAQRVDPDAPLARGGMIRANGLEVLQGSPLQWAAHSGRADILRDLLKAGADPHGKGINDWEVPWPSPVTEVGWTLLGWLNEAGPPEPASRPNRFAVGHPLGAAALGGHLEIIRLLVEGAGISPDDRELTGQGDETGWTALMYAAISGHGEVAAYLLQKGATPSAGDKEYGYQALHFAARAGSADVVAALLGAGADLRALDHLGQTPLHLAATNKDPACCRLLLAVGAEIGAKTKLGWTPLHLAAVNGRAQVCEALLDAKALVDAKDSLGRTPLHLAAATGQNDICRALLARGANPLETTEADLTPLHFAAASGDVNTLLLLYQAGADVNGRDNLGYTPLHYAAWLDHEKSAALLILRGARVKAEGEEGFTPLHVALLEDARATVPLLLVLGADPNAPDHDGWTPLHIAAACRLDYFEATGPMMFSQDEQQKAQAQSEWQAQVRRLPINRLLEFGAQPGLRNRAGQTPLHIAAGAVNLMSMLGGDSGDVTRKGSHAGLDQHQTEVLFTAVREGDREAARDAVKAGADLRARDADGKTLAYIAAGDDDMAMLEFLAEMGADLSAPSRWGQTPFDLAVKTSEKLTRWFAEHRALPKTKDGEPPHLGMVATWMTPPTIRLLVSLGFAVDAPPGDTK